MMTEIDKVKATGITDAELEKTQKPSRKQLRAEQQHHARHR